MSKKRKTGISALIQKYIFSSGLSHEARQLNSVYIVGFFSALATAVLRIISGDSIAVVSVPLGIAAFVIIIMCISNRSGRYALFRWIMIGFVCNVFFVCAFFILGGVNSSMPAYFVLSMVLQFYLTHGKKRAVFVAVHAGLIIASYCLSTLPAFSRFLLDDGGSNRYFDQLHSIIISGFCIGFISVCQNRLFMEESSKADSAGRDLEKRNKLLKVINEMAEILLSDREDIDKAIFKAMELMARNVQVNRIYIWENKNIKGALKFEQQYEWVDEKEKSKIFRAGLDYYYVDSIPGLKEFLFAGNCVNSPISLMGERDKKVFSPFLIRSILIIPVFLQERFWGFLSFDDLEEERFFPNEDVSILRSGCLLLVNAIVRNRNHLMIDARMRQQVLMAGISRGFISREPLSSLISLAIKQMGEFMKVSKIEVFVRDNETGKDYSAYHWPESLEAGARKAGDVPANLSESIHSSFPDIVPETGYITALCCDDALNGFGGRFSFMNRTGLKSFMWAPVYVDNKLWGVIDIEECTDERTWTESDIQFAGAVSSTIAGALTRELIDKERSAALEQALQASRAKGNFLANMSHEMRTPMNAIIGMTSIGKNSPEIDKKNHAFEKIENSSNHLLGVINDILDMSKIEANKFNLSFVTFDFEKVLQRVVNIINFHVEEHRQIFTVDIDEKIPRFLVGDDLRLAQVIMNLLSNAVKFTPDLGSIRLAAKLNSEKNRLCNIQIEVSDTGIGISPEQREKLFHSFEQAESGTSRKFGGTGLGLAISKRIVELMDGEIWVESELNRGSKFMFTIQVKKARTPKAALAGQTAGKKDIRILAVDTNTEVLDFISRTTSCFGFRCDTAAGSEEALRLINSNGSYDICVIAMELPDINGIELAGKIKKHTEGKSSIILTSAAELDYTKEDAAFRNIDRFISKPLFPSAVVDAINECFGTKNTESGSGETVLKKPPNFEGFTILLAEDIEINREIVITLLEPTAITIDCAENGKEAVAKFAANPEKYDIIFMDVQMPEMDGYEATAAIRAMKNDRAASIPIIAMTANVFREDVEKCLASGMNAHVGKPIDLEDVITRLRKYLPVKRR